MRVHCLVCTILFGQLIHQALSQGITSTTCTIVVSTAMCLAASWLLHIQLVCRSSTSREFVVNRSPELLRVGWYLVSCVAVSAQTPLRAKLIWALSMMAAGSTSHLIFKLRIIERINLQI